MKRRIKNFRKTELGYYELKNKPSKEALRSYYSEKYFQDGKGAYCNSYSKEEIKYINNKLAQEYEIILELNNSLASKTKKRFLDIGCGEGFALKYFLDKAWSVVGLDHSDYGCKSHNSDCLAFLRIGDIYTHIGSLIATGEKFDVIMLKNVLEHVLDPMELLKIIKKLITKNGIVVLEVPNDFSALQEYLFKNKHITKRFWVVEPDHISYFNRDGLYNLARKSGWVSKKILSTFPIDFNLFNKGTNYIADKRLGRECHGARIILENLLHSISVKKTNTFYEALADLGLGRNLIFFLQKK